MGGAHGAVLVMAVAAVMVILVVGAGTTWVYLADARRADATRDRTSPRDGGAEGKGLHAPGDAHELERAA